MRMQKVLKHATAGGMAGLAGGAFLGRGAHLNEDVIKMGLTDGGKGDAKKCQGRVSQEAKTACAKAQRQEGTQHTCSLLWVPCRSSQGKEGKAARAVTEAQSSRLSAWMKGVGHRRSLSRRRPWSRFSWRSHYGARRMA